VIEAEQLIYLLLERAPQFDGPQHPEHNGQAVDIRPDVDVNQLDQLPAVFFTLTGDGEGSGLNLYPYTLNVSAIGNGMDAAKALMKTVDEIVVGWGTDNTTTVVEGVGWISTVDPGVLPTRQPSSVLNGLNVTQYDASYNVALRN
jgi:hypothetical protein